MGESVNKVGITAPSGNVLDIEAVDRARALFEGRGWDVTVGESVYSSSMRFGGSSESARTLDFNHMCMKEELVLCARGGYGFSRILPGVDFSVIAQKGTWVAGFSDITFFSLAYLALTGGKSLQAPTASVLGNLECDPYTIETFFNVLSATDYTLDFYTPFHDFETEGKLWGGNLSILCAALGTPYFPRIKGGILFVEDVDEPAYKIERNLNQLIQSGVIENQKALLLGDFSQIRRSAHDFGYGLDEALSFAAMHTSTPFISGLPFGHKMKMATLVVGAQSVLSIRGHKALLTMKGCPAFRERIRL